MIPIDLRPEHWDKARINANKIPSNIKNSIRSGMGRLVGSLGEVLVAEYLGVDVTNTPHYDLIFKGQKIDVKTKERTVDPQPDYNCTVADFNPHQKCDFYFFVSITKDKKTGQFTKGWLCGVVAKEKFYEMATFNREGEPDPSSPFGWPFKADCYNLPISQLTPPPAAVGAAA